MRRDLSSLLLSLLCVAALCCPDTFAASAPPAKRGLVVESTPRLASVFLDAKFSGVTPLQIASVPKGPHVVKLTRHGYTNWVKVVAISDVLVTLKAELTPRADGVLIVESQPDQAEVLVEGQSKGRTPLTLRGLPTGKLQLQARKVEYLPWTGEVEIVGGKPVTVRCALQAKAEAMKKFNEV